MDCWARCLCVEEFITECVQSTPSTPSCVGQTSEELNTSKGECINDNEIYHQILGMIISLLCVTVVGLVLHISRVVYTLKREHQHQHEEDEDSDFGVRLDRHISFKKESLPTGEGTSSGITFTSTRAPEEEEDLEDSYM